MKYLMLKGLKKTWYFLAFLALTGLIGWVAIVASEQPSNTAEYRKRLNITAANVFAPVDADSPDDSLKFYAVNVVHTPPFRNPFIGYGIYLGNGMIITAAHVVGRWPFFTNLRVFIAGQNLRARVIKEGSPERVDLALLSVDKAHLPISLRLRRNPLCKGTLIPGTNVVVVVPERTARSRIISPQLIAPQFRTRFKSLISNVEGSGSGVFDAERRCLLGIISREIERYPYRKKSARMPIKTIRFVGYFVPASKIADFTPPDSHF
jgi:hypothetical protein